VLATNLPRLHPGRCWLRRVDWGIKAVAATYDWPADLSDDEVFSRLLALNLARGAGPVARSPGDCRCRRRTAARQHRILRTAARRRSDEPSDIGAVTHGSRRAGRSHE
jgi:hypothetical protein